MPMIEGGNDPHPHDVNVTGGERGVADPHPFGMGLESRRGLGFEDHTWASVK